MEWLSNFWEFLKTIWDWFVVIVPTIDAVCISLIAYYTFRLTILPKKLKFIGFKQNFNRFEGNSLEITLENRSLCPCIIESVDLLLGSFKIKASDQECTIDGFKTAKITMPPYSEIIFGEEKIDIDPCSLGKMFLLVKTTRGVQHIRYETMSKWAYKRLLKKESQHKQTTVCRTYHGEKLIVPHVKYILSYIDQSESIQTVFIEQSGLMSNHLFGYNCLSKEIMTDIATLKEHFDSEFKKYNLRYSITEVNKSFAEDSPCESAECK